MKKTLIVITALFLTLILAATLHAAAGGKKAEQAASEDSSASEPAPTTTPGEVQGEISSIGTNFLTIIYKRDNARGIEYEMLLPIESGVNYEYKKKFQDFSVGDTVKVKFDDITEGKPGNEKTKRKVRILTFLSPAKNKPAAPVPAEPGDGIADDPIFQKN